MLLGGIVRFVFFLLLGVKETYVGSWERLQGQRCGREGRWCWLSIVFVLFLGVGRGGYVYVVLS